MDVIIYSTEDDGVQIEVHLEKETVWLNQDQMAELFGRERSVITKHLRNVFKEGELEESSVRAKFAHTAADGKSYQVHYYNPGRQLALLRDQEPRLINRANV